MTVKTLTIEIEYVSVKEYGEADDRRVLSVKLNGEPTTIHEARSQFLRTQQVLTDSQKASILRKIEEAKALDIVTTLCHNGCNE